MTTDDTPATATLPFFTAPAGQIITATATSASGETSEFSACVTVPLAPTTFTVTNTNDSGTGSLRQAILDANARAGHAGQHRVQYPGYRAVHHRAAVDVAGNHRRGDDRRPSQAGYAGSPLIELNGAAAGVRRPDLGCPAGPSTRSGLVINRFIGDGIAISGSVGSIVIANYIGTNIAGTAALANGIAGISVNSPANTIGGTTAVEANLISGNADGYSARWLRHEYIDPR